MSYFRKCGPIACLCSAALIMTGVVFDLSFGGALSGVFALSSPAPTSPSDAEFTGTASTTPDGMAVGRSFRPRLQISYLAAPQDRGDISGSFPDPTRRSSYAPHYSLGHESAHMNSHATGSFEVGYYDGVDTHKTTQGSLTPGEHLLVEIDDVSGNQKSIASHTPSGQSL